MPYCTQCQRLMLAQDECCPQCGSALRPADPGDPVLLVCADMLKADMITALLRDTNIPHSKAGEHGVGFTMRAGPLLETIRIHVPYGAYAQAHDLIAQTFGEDPDIMRALQ